MLEDLKQAEELANLAAVDASHSELTPALREAIRSLRQKAAAVAR
jgi:hypothetical protein